MSTSSASLLLLPGLSLPVQKLAVRAAYQNTIATVLQQIKPPNTRSVARLDVAVTFTSSFPATASRTALFEPVQLVLAELYTLTGVAAAKHDVELDIPGGIDVRLFFLDLQSDTPSSKRVDDQALCGPLVDGSTFVSSRNYGRVYLPDGETGQQAQDLLSSLWKRQQSTIPSFQTVSCAALQPSSSNESGSEILKAGKSHTRVVIGGTFDHLHIGHKLLLTAEVFLAQPDEAKEHSQPREITIGITGDELLVNKKHASVLESWEEREQNTAEFVESILVFHPDPTSIRTIEYQDEPGPNGKVIRVKYGNEVVINYTRISDPYGPTITDESITAIVVSKETRSGGKAVNDKRVEKGWHALDVFEVDILDVSADDSDPDKGVEKSTFESKISSSEIRKRLEMKANSANI